MKKIVAMLLVVAMTVGTFAGCGQSVEEAASSQADTVEPTVEEEADTCYEVGRAYLYGLNGYETDLEATGYAGRNRMLL